MLLNFANISAGAPYMCNFLSVCNKDGLMLLLSALVVFVEGVCCIWLLVCRGIFDACKLQNLRWERME